MINLVSGWCDKLSKKNASFIGRSISLGYDNKIPIPSFEVQKSLIF